MIFVFKQNIMFWYFTEVTSEFNSFFLVYIDIVIDCGSNVEVCTNFLALALIYTNKKKISTRPTSLMY